MYMSVVEQTMQLKKERKELDEICKFIGKKKTELRNERNENGKKYSNGGYEIKWEYWNRYNEIKGALTSLRELEKFVNWQKAKIGYEIYLIHNPQSELINMEIEKW